VQGPRTALNIKSSFKALTVHTDWVPEDQTINQVYYKEVLTRRKRPEIWNNGSWILQHNNASADNVLSVKMFLAKHKISVLEHPPYSPDLALCDFFIFKVQVCINRNPFQFCRCSEGKSNGGNKEAIRKGPAAFLSTVKNSHEEVWGLGRGLL
jgi:hypothetical protein